MRLKVWILLAIAVLLLAWRWRRERFEETDTIKGPDGLTAEELARIKRLVTPPSTLSNQELRDVIGGFWSWEWPSQVAGQSPARRGWSEAMNPLSYLDVDDYLATMYPSISAEKKRQYKALLQAYYITQGEPVFAAQQARLAEELQRFRSSTGPTGPVGGAGITIWTGGTAVAVADQGAMQNSSGGAGVQLGQQSACPSGQAMAPWNVCSPILSESAGTCPTGETLVPAVESSSPTCRAVSGAIGPVVCPTGATFWPSRGKCVVSSVSLSMSSSPSADPTTQSLSPGSGTMSTGPVGSSSPLGFDLFGPGYTDRGSRYAPSGSDGEAVDRGRYPLVYGGRQKPGKGSPTGPTLPSSGSLGSDLGSMFFPFSRTPGDMDLVPDPFRALNNFSLASYSPKTDPVPFLPDFSAFQS